MYDFVEPNFDVSSRVEGASGAGRKFIRSKVMRDHRRRKREADEADGDSPGAVALSGTDAWRQHRSAKAAAGHNNSQRTKAERVSEYSERQNFEAYALLQCDKEQVTSCLTSGLLTLSIHGGNYYSTSRIATFVHGYFGKSAQGSPGLRSTLSYWASPKFRAMRAAGEALGLCHLGSWANDDRINLEAIKAHSVAVNALRCELKGARVNLIAALGTAEALLCCESYRLVSSGPNATTNHLLGVLAILRSTTHQTATAELRTFLFRKFRQISLMQSLELRRALVGEHIWWLCAQIQAPSKSEDLMLLAVQLPALLETSEIMRKSGEGDIRIVKGARSRLLRLELDLEQWFEDFESENDSKFPMDHHDDLPAIYQLRDRPSVTVPALQCSSFLHGLHRAFYWTCLLLLRQSLLALPAQATSITNRDLGAETETTADHLCASVPFLLQSAGGMVNKGKSIRAPLHFAGQWFKSQNNDIKLQWCKEMESDWSERLKFLHWDALLPQSFHAIYWLA